LSKLPPAALRCPPLPPVIPIPTRAVARSPLVGSRGGSRTLRRWRSIPPPDAMLCEFRGLQSSATVEETFIRPLAGFGRPLFPLSRPQRFRVTAGAAFRPALLVVAGLLVELRASPNMPLRLRSQWRYSSSLFPAWTTPRGARAGPRTSRPSATSSARSRPSRPLPVRQSACTERGPSARSQPRCDGTCTALLPPVVSVQ
jgi:hypothetical protein